MADSRHSSATRGPAFFAIAATTVVALLCMSSTAFAQASRGVLQHMGFEAGIGRATFSGASSPAPVTSVLAGVYLTPGPDTITWQVEGLVHWKGARVGDATVRFLDFEVPALLRINLTPARRSGWYLLAGPTIAYRARASAATDGGSSDLTQFTPTLEYGALLGAGYNSRRMGAGIRVQQGLNGTNLVIDGRTTRTRSIAVVTTFRLE